MTICRNDCCNRMTNDNYWMFIILSQNISCTEFYFWRNSFNKVQHWKEYDDKDNKVLLHFWIHPQGDFKLCKRVNMICKKINLQCKKVNMQKG